MSRSPSIDSETFKLSQIHLVSSDEKPRRTQRHSLSQQQLTRDLRSCSTTSVRGGSFRSLKGHQLFRQDAVSNSSTPESTPRLLSPADAYHRPVVFAFDSRSRIANWSGQNSLEENKRSKATPLLTRAFSHQLPSSQLGSQSQEQHPLTSSALPNTKHTHDSSSTCGTSSADSVVRLTLPPSGPVERRISFRRSRSGLSSATKDQTETPPTNGDLECFDPYPRQKSGRTLLNERLAHLRPPRLDQVSNQGPVGYDHSLSYPLLSVNQSPPSTSSSSILTNLSPPSRQLSHFPRSPSNFKNDCFFVFPPVIPEEQTTDKFEIATSAADMTSASILKNVPFVDCQSRIPPSPPIMLPSSSSPSSPTFSSFSTSSSLHLTSNCLTRLQPTVSTTTTSSTSSCLPPSSSSSSSSFPKSLAIEASTGSGDRDDSADKSHVARVMRSRMLMSSKGHSKVVYDSDDGPNKSSNDTD